MESPHKDSKPVCVCVCVWCKASGCLWAPVILIRNENKKEGQAALKATANQL